MAGLTRVDYAQAAYNSWRFWQSFEDATKNADFIDFDVTNFENGKEAGSAIQREFDYI